MVPPRSDWKMAPASEEVSLFPRLELDQGSPDGLVYRRDFISAEEEAALISAVRCLEFSEVRMRGQVARRRTAHFGWRYGYESWRVEPGAPIPESLLLLRQRAAALAEVDARALEEVLVTEYPTGAGIGWHRDAPAFDVVVGVSLLSSCRFRFARGVGPSRETRAFHLEPRSAYVLSGPARWQWQHSIPPAKSARLLDHVQDHARRRRGGRAAASGRIRPLPATPTECGACRPSTASGRRRRGGAGPARRAGRRPAC